MNTIVDPITFKVKSKKTRKADIECDTEQEAIELAASLKKVSEMTDDELFDSIF